MSFVQKFGQPVKRSGVENYLRYTLISFACSVIATRLFLSLTDYPSIGNGHLHIAHVLWGGLLLFSAAILPLIFSNRWIYSLISILAGGGLGLFIDEVGKFITQSNDYFYPPAMPIIYASFLLLLLVYFRLRTPTIQNPRADLYESLDDIQEILDHDLDEREYDKLSQHLKNVIQNSTDPEYKKLATALLHFLNSGAIQIVPVKTGLRRRGLDLAKTFETRFLGYKVTTILTTLCLLTVSLSSLYDLYLFTRSIFRPAYLDQLILKLVNQNQIAQSISEVWFLIRLGLEGVVGILLLVATYFFLKKNEKKGLALARFGLLVSLTMVNLLVFYVDQFRAVSNTLIQFLLLLVINHYRKRFLPYHTIGTNP